MKSNSEQYEKTHEIRYALNCFPKEWKAIDTGDGRSTIWHVGSTRYVYNEAPSGHTSFIAYDISPDWAITLSME